VAADDTAFLRDTESPPGRGDWRYAVIVGISTVTNPPIAPLLWRHPKEA